MLQELIDAVRGQWRPTPVIIRSEKRPLASGAYTINDVVSESATTGTAWHFRNVAKRDGGGGYIVGCLITAQATAIASEFTVFVHNAPPTCVLNDGITNTAPVVADRNIYLGRIYLDASDDIGTGMSETEASPSTPGRLPKMFVCQPGSRDLYCILAIRNVVDITDTVFLTVSLLVEQW